MMKTIKLVLCLCLSLLCDAYLQAKVKPNSIFSDHMVLQNGVPLSVWGTAGDKEKITVKFNGQTETTTAVNGKWLVKLKPMPYVTIPTQMIIAGEDTTIAINDILVGEVWICSGQSNMERQLGPRPPQPPIYNWEKERDQSDYPLIREYYVPLKYSKEKVADANSKWSVCSPQTVTDLSAVGYFFARDLFNSLNVPVGILFAAYGGTPAEDWTSLDALKVNPKLTPFVSNYDSIISKAWHPDGELISGLYNGMLYPIIPYSVKGVAWYQGEANDSRAKDYPVALSTMIQNWRTDFQNNDLPFLIVQVAPYKYLSPEIREAQLKVAQTVKNTALIVTTDCGLANDIHPPHKQPVGDRLAKAARVLAYGKKSEYSGPIYKSHKVQGDKIILQFSHVGKGLVAKDSTGLKGFQVAGSDNVFVSAAARIQGKTIVVSNIHVKNPVAVRYGWSNVPDVNLFNRDGFPASPFRTDVTTAPKCY